MRQYTASEILRVLGKKGYKSFIRGKYNLNIVGVRSHNSESDMFDDAMCVVFQDDDGKWRIRQYKCTTDPGKHWLLNPLNVNGTLIMKPGQYRGAYKIGIHGRSGRYPYKALEQAKPMEYVRDNNKNNKLDFSLFEEDKNIIEGIFKTNIHRASKWKSTYNVNKYSAGCQVLQDPNDFNEFMALCDKQLKYGHGNSFTYTLLEEKDL